MEQNRAKDSARRRDVYAAKKSPQALVELQRRREIAADERRRGRKAASARHRLKSRYGLDEADYQRIVAEQGGRCACCGAIENIDGRLWCVDHDHETGAIRGLLCTRCNAGIGNLGDNIEGVKRALVYLERAAQRPTVRTVPALRINLLRAA